MRNDCERRVLPLPIKPGNVQKSRKTNVNRNRDGSARRINGLVYVDFIYLGTRVRESSGLPWNEKNARTVREQLDRIMVAINSGTFRYHETFPASKKRDHFQRQEMLFCGFKKKP